MRMAWTRARAMRASAGVGGLDHQGDRLAVFAPIVGEDDEGLGQGDRVSAALVDLVVGLESLAVFDHGTGEGQLGDLAVESRVRLDGDQHIGALLTGDQSRQ